MLLIKERATITVGVTADSAVTPTVIVALFGYCSCTKYLQSMYDSHLHFLLSYIKI